VRKINEHRGYYKQIIGLALILANLCIQNTYAQQRPHFTQYISNELIINPAYAGAEEALSTTFVHRSQWSDLEGAPSTQTFTAHSLFKSKKIGLGLAVINDEIGVHSILNAAASYAYHIQLDEETYFSMGLQFGIEQKKSDYNSLLNQVQVANDPTLSGADLSSTSFEFGTGVYLKSRRLVMGISVPNMLPERSVIDDSLNLSLSNNNFYFLSRYEIPANNNISFKPGFLIIYHPGLPVTYDLNLAAIFNDVLLVGMSYRSMKSINAIIQAKITPQLKIGYSFDYALSGGTGIQSNSHEFMIHYLFRFSSNRITNPR